MAAEPTRLTRITDNKLHTCRVYLETTRQLADALAQEDMAAMERHIRRREELILVMNGLDRQAGRYGGYRLRGSVEEMRRILHKTDLIDKICREAVKNRYDRFKKTMTAVKGYAQKRESRPPLFSLQT